MTLADRIVVLEAGEVRQFGSPLELYHMPQNQFVAGFIGSPRMNFLSVEVTALKTDGVVVEGPSVARVQIAVDPSACKAGDAATLGIRPEHIIRAAKAGHGIEETVALVEMLGHQTYVEGEAKGKESLSALFDGTETFGLGEKIYLTFKPEDCHLFLKGGKGARRLQAPKVAGVKKASRKNAA